jgi:acetylornithine/succinyldiaminopimelate/putrescine aminotransferase
MLSGSERRAPGTGRRVMLCPDGRSGAFPVPGPRSPVPEPHPAELAVYSRLPIRPVRGSGCFLWDGAGRRYLDLYGGHAVAITGHAHPAVVAAVAAQAGELLFYSNAVPLDVRDVLITRLAALAPVACRNVFLVNSGAEANDNALGLARRLTGRSRIVSVEGGFHGRSLATLAASGIPKYRKLADSGGAGRELVERTTVVPFDDAAALAAAVGGETAAVILEPVQGLAGARDHSTETLRAARTACDAAGAMLIFDEVQCGCGRTGAFTAAQSYGVSPDILTLAKGIASGLPMGAVLVSDRIAAAVKGGELRTTFGGGPVPCAAGAATLELMVTEDLPGRASRSEQVFRKAIAGLPGVARVTGRGLLLGVVLDRPAKPVQQALFDRGILVGSAEDPSVLRLLPPLVVEDEHVALFAAALEEVLSS